VAKQDIVIVSKTLFLVMKNLTVVLIVVRIRLLKTIKNCRNQELFFVIDDLIERTSVNEAMRLDESHVHIIVLQHPFHSEDRLSITVPSQLLFHGAILIKTLMNLNHSYQSNSYSILSPISYSTTTIPQNQLNKSFVPIQRAAQKVRPSKD